MDTSFDEARRCPRCTIPGYATLTKRNRDNSRSFTVTCMNDRCVWFDTKWLIEVNPDGSLPEPKLNRRKSYPHIPDRTEEIRASIDRSLEQQVNNPPR